MTKRVEDNHIYQDFELFEYRVHATIRYRDPPGLYAYSPPGLGKTYTIQKVHRELFDAPVETHSSGSALGLLDYIYDHRDGVIVLDDFDKMFFDPNMMSLMKKLLDTNPPRILSHRVRGEGAIPPFRVTAAVIILTNRDLDNPAHFGRTFYSQYIKPFKSRLAASSFRITDDPMTVLDYTLHLAPKILREASLYGHGKRLLEPQQKELFEFILTNYALLPEVSPRMVADLAKVRLNFDDDRMWYRQREKFLSDVRRQREREEAEFDKPRERAEKEAGAHSPLLPKMPRRDWHH